MRNICRVVKTRLLPGRKLIIEFLLPGMNKVKFAFILVSAVAVGLFFGFLIGENYRLGGAINSSELDSLPGRVSIMVDFGDGRVSTYTDLDLIQNETAFELTERIAEVNNIGFDFKEYSGLGILVAQIGDKTNGENDMYWQYWVNNKSPEIGAGEYLVEAGDAIMWKFLKYQGQ